MPIHGKKPPNPSGVKPRPRDRRRPPAPKSQAQIRAAKQGGGKSSSSAVAPVVGLAFGLFIGLPALLVLSLVGLWMHQGGYL